MRTLQALVRGIADIAEILLRRVRRVEQNAALQERRISDLEGARGSQLHSMEEKQEAKIEREERRQDTLSDQELARDLERQYGTTRWAKRVINELMSKRRGGKLEH